MLNSVGLIWGFWYGTFRGIYAHILASHGVHLKGLSAFRVWMHSPDIWAQGIFAGLGICPRVFAGRRVAANMSASPRSAGNINDYTNCLLQPKACAISQLAAQFNEWM